MEAINVIEAKKLIEENNSDLELIDVRTPAEYQQGHIKGARLLPLDEITQWEATLDKNKTYLINCRSGGRSAMACEHLERLGFKTINLIGGIIDWQEEGYELEK